MASAAAEWRSTLWSLSEEDEDKNFCGATSPAEPVSRLSKLAIAVPPNNQSLPQFMAALNANGQNQTLDKLTHFNKGTTTLSFVFKHGIIVACDSRATQGGRISCQVVRKIIQINEYLVGTMAGGAADCSYWERHLGRLCRVHELRTGRRPSVAHAAQMLADIFWSYRGYGLRCGTMVAGWDSAVNKPALFMVDDDGTKLKGTLFSVGSGSMYAYGVLDRHYKYDMSVEEAHELGRRAIFQAGHRDAASGGFVRVGIVDQNGWRYLTEAEDVDELYRSYYPRH